MKKYVCLLLSIIMVILVSACGQGSTTGKSSNSADTPSKKTTNLKLAHTLAETHILHKASAKFAEAAKKKTNDQINFNIYSSGQLGNDLELIEQVMNGELDALVVGVPFFSGFAPALDAYLMPYLIDNYDLERKVLNAPITREMLNSLDRLGLKGLSLVEGGLVHIGNTKQEIRKPEHMSGLKIRTGSSDLAVESLKVQGAVPTPMVLNEVYSGLQTNVINGVQTNLVTIASAKFHEVIKHISILGQYSFPAVVAVNKKVYNQLSEADKKAIMEAAQEASEFTLSEIKKLDEESIKTIEKAGVKIITPTDEEKKVFINSTQGIYDKYMNKDPLIKKFVNTVREMK